MMFENIFWLKRGKSFKSKQIDESEIEKLMQTGAQLDGELINSSNYFTNLKT